MTVNNKLHPQVIRLLERCEVEFKDVTPEKQEQWQLFLSKLSRSFEDYEQDQYLLERSMQISSREMMELNEKLEVGQQIAHLGFWQYSRNDNRLIWSKEMYKLAGMDPGHGVPTFKKILNCVHKNDRRRLEEVMNEAFSGQSFELELQFQNQTDKKYYWHYIKCDADVTIKNSQEFIAGIVIDISDRKRLEQSAAKSQSKLLAISRQAGMSEVATYVLHNIGNIMNSANVSLNLLKDNFSRPYYKKLFKIKELLTDHQLNLNQFLTQNEKGKLIPRYLIELIEIIENNHLTNLEEIDQLNVHLSHVKDIVSMQKIFGGAKLLYERVCVPELVETALKMTIKATRSEIRISKHFGNISFINTDKSKLMQILVNLLQNAHDALKNNVHEETKHIQITLNQVKDRIKIGINDNGIGIPCENMKRIFSFGFTTKTHGHGYGLHSCALSAKELGGELTAESEGLNQGATFVINLPINDSEKKHSGV